MSLHIKELESRLDALLVVRGRRQAELTPAGQVLVEDGRRLLAASDELADRVRRRAAGREGVVRVGVSAGVSTRLLPLMLQALHRRAPGVEVRLEAAGSADAMARLQAGTLDVAIVASPQTAGAQVQVRPWRNDPMVALLPGEWDAPETVTPQWLAQRRWASFAPATQMHGLIAGWFGRAGLHPRPYLTLSYPGALKSLAAASQSAAILPLEEVQDMPQRLDDQGERLEKGGACSAPLVQVRHLDPPLMRPMALACRQLPTPDAAVTHLLDVLGEFAD